MFKLIRKELTGSKLFVLIYLHYYLTNQKDKANKPKRK